MRRASVTTAINALQRCGAIEHLRGNLQVLDRGVLERLACSCYFGDWARYADILGGSAAHEWGRVASASGEDESSSHA